ncbi:MAG: hypothetical protein ACOYNI_04180 [Acidimicrobiia bacterium]
MSDNESNARQSWNDVGDRMAALGLKLKLHLESGSDAETEARAAFEHLGDAIRDSLDAVARAAKDPAIHADLHDAGTSLADALASTFTELGSGIRNTVRRSD